MRTLRRELLDRQAPPPPEHDRHLEAPEHDQPQPERADREREAADGGEDRRSQPPPLNVVHDLTSSSERSKRPSIGEPKKRAIRKANGSDGE